MRGGFGEPHDAQVIGLAVAGGICRHVGEYDIRLAAEQSLQTLGRGFVEEIQFQEFDAGNGLHVEDVERDDAAGGA